MKVENDEREICVKREQPSQCDLAVKLFFDLRPVFIMLLMTSCLSLAQTGKSDKEAPQKVPRQTKFGPVYVPSTDLSLSTTTGGIHTTYRLAADPSTGQPLVVPGDSVKTDVLKNIRSAYGIPDGAGSGAIAIIVAYDHPTAREDLEEFSRKFNVPVCSDDQCLEIVPPLNSVPNGPCSWSREAAIGLEWAHAIAPRARLILVEADTNCPADMFAAVDRATKKLLMLGGGEIVLPWGKLEGTGEHQIGQADEAKFDKVFTDGVVYLASSGDSGHVVSYPATSKKVVAIGGTIIDFDQNGAVRGEAGWSHTGGGDSQFIAKPDFQVGVENTPRNHRSTPDLAMNADDVPIFNSTACESYKAGWQYADGTSVAVVLAAGMVNVAGHNKASTTAELQNIYDNRGDAGKIRDVVTGPASGCCARGYDTFTGVGAPVSLEFDAPHKPESKNPP
jgi:subtilase family serine protease